MYLLSCTYCSLMVALYARCALPRPKQTNAAQTSDIRQILAAGPPSVWQRGVAPSTPPRAAAVHLPSPSVKLPFESEWIGEPLPSDAIDTEIDVGSMDLVGSVDFGSLESGDFVTLDVAEINESALQINGRTTFWATDRCLKCLPYKKKPIKTFYIHILTRQLRAILSNERNNKDIRIWPVA